jgi:hypothetical protein
LRTAVAVEKLGFPENWLKTDDQKCIRIPRKSFIGHPGATIFPCALGERVFQQPQPFPLAIFPYHRITYDNAISQQLSSKPFLMLMSVRINRLSSLDFGCCQVHERFSSRRDIPVGRVRGASVTSRYEGSSNRDSIYSGVTSGLPMIQASVFRLWTFIFSGCCGGTARRNSFTAWSASIRIPMPAT